jgi:predicted nucleic acid-binding protein
VTTYVDSSALFKRYVQETDSDLAEQFLTSDPVLVTSWVTAVEVRRNLARILDRADFIPAVAQFNLDLDSFAMIACDEIVARAAGDIGEVLGVRSLDAIHLASAQRLQIRNLTFVTFDLRQAQAARSLGFAVLGS